MWPDGSAFLRNAEQLAAQVIARVVAPPPPIDLNQWAEDNIVFGPESPFQGPYDPELFPFFHRILEVLGPEHPAREIVLMKSAQLGGTVIAQIFLGGSMDLDPTGFLYTHPTTDNAKRWVKTKWRAFIRGTSALSRLFPLTQSRDGQNSLLYQERIDGRGWLQVSGANSEASLSMLSVPRQVQDDLSKWDINDAGDPESQANSRSLAFEWAKIAKIGTPLLKGGCRITKAYENSSQERYFVPCPHCGHTHPLEWENLQANIEAHPEEDPFFTCPDCGTVIEQQYRREMLLKGQWVAGNSDAAVMGFYIWTAYSPLVSWRRIRDAWLKAKGDPAAEQTFLNDWIGRAYEAAGISPPWEELRDRAEESGHQRGVIPLDGLLLTMGIDVQGDRLECHVKAFGKDLRSWTVDYEVIEGHISEKETMAKLDKIIERSWPDTFGNRRALDQVAIDGNAWTEDVLAWARRKPASKVMVVRGARSEQAPPLAKVKYERTAEGKVKRKSFGRFFNVGVSGLKMALYQNLRKKDPLERGFCGFPKGLEDDFFQQLCAERRAPHRRKDGFEEYRWTKDPAQRNEVLDTDIYAQAAAIRLRWRSMPDHLWDELAARLEQPPIGGQLDLEEALLAAPLAAPETAPVANEKPAEPEMSAASGWLKDRGRNWLRK